MPKDISGKEHSSEMLAYAGLFAVWFAYISLTLLSPFPSAYRQMGLGDAADNFVQLSVAVPRLIGWLAGCYGALKMYDAASIMTEKEGSLAYRRIALGFTVLVATFPIAYLLSATRGYLGNAHPLNVPLTMLTNYLFVYGPLVGFAAMYVGTRHLRRASAEKPFSEWALAGFLAFVLFAGCYAWLVFTNSARLAAPSADYRASFYLSDIGIILTVVIPFLASCVLALLAVVRFSRHARLGSSFVESKATRMVILGIAFMLVAAVTQQCLTSLGPIRREKLGLPLFLLVVYIFVWSRMLGFAYMAYGANKLATIERIMRKYAGPPDAKLSNTKSQRP